jgi:hypothetical protein
VQGYVGLIPRYMRNQTKARFSQEPNKKIIFKQIIKARFKQITKNDERSVGNHSIPVLKRALTIFPSFPVSSSTQIWRLELHDVPTGLATRLGLSSSPWPFLPKEEMGRTKE